jgi:hypothetical protein
LLLLSLGILELNLEGGGQKSFRSEFSNHHRLAQMDNISFFCQNGKFPTFLDESALKKGDFHPK